MRASRLRQLRPRIAAGLALAALVLFGSVDAASASGLFSTLPGELLQGRYTPAVGLLPDGRLLVAGGFKSESALKSAEILNPATGTSEALSAEEFVAHGESATVALPSGQILIIGGWHAPSVSLKQIEGFDPTTKTFTKLSTELLVERDGGGAVLLPNGKVFIVAGEKSGGEYVTSAEVYDPATSTIAAVKGHEIAGRYQPSVALLPNGKVLIAGGYIGTTTEKYVRSAEIYDPASETFEALTAGHELVEGRDEAGVVTLQNGKVLIAGGYNTTSKYLASAEEFDYTTETFTKLADALATPRAGDTGVLLPDGRALFVAGYNEAGIGEARYLKSSEVTAVSAPAVSTSAASPVSMTSATVRGAVSTEATATVYFQVGTTTAYGTTTPIVPLGGATSPQTVAATLTGLAPATTYHYRVVAHNFGGPAFGSDQTFTTAPPVPAVASVHQAHLRWREGGALARISRRGAPVGTTFSLSLNTPAKVSFAFTQRTGGRKVHGRCVAQTHRNRSARRCSRTVTRGTLSFNGHAGTNNVAFQGRVSRSVKLRPGTYTLVITAAGPSGISTPQRLTFTIVR